ncbi:hypothetical protein [Chryseobacterium sp.]|uniref:hypothetical protein n=1 Tax=Chryseobacterium sp. TaxID=1871047 RepID=UPI0031E24DDC
MEEVLDTIKPLAKKRFVKDGIATLQVYTIQDDSFLIIDIENMSVAELSIEDILEFFRDIASWLGGTGSGNFVVTVNGPTTYYLGVRANGIDATIYNNTDGRTSMSYQKL